MMKSIRNLLRQDREKYVIPRRVQDVIPIQKIWEDGIFLTGGRYAKTFRFTDINYQVASEPDKEKMFRGYSAIINSLDCGATTKITIFNHRMSQINFEKSILMPMQWDGLDDYREEYNQMLLDKATNGNGIVQEKFLTVSVRKKDVDAARSFFARVEADLSSHFAALGSTCVPMNAMERLQILHRFYRRGEENEFRFSLRDSARKGHSFRDYICPDSMERHSDYLQIGKRYARVLYLKDYASYMQWFQQRGLWLDGSAEPVPGMLIFFDWAPQDGVPDHVGIVEKVENGMVYTVEGNSRDMCRQKQYALGSNVILGYGMTAG